MKKTIVSLAAGFLLAGAAATSVSAQEYKVQEGDTLSGIGHEYDVSVDDLKAWNDLDSDFIVVNQLLDINNDDNSDNAENQDVAPVADQMQQEAPVEPSDDQAADEEGDQEVDQPEADKEEASPEEETQPESEPSDDQGAEQEDANAEEPQQEANDEAVENNEDEAVEQEPANEEPAEEQALQEASDDQDAEEEADPEANQSEANDEEATNDEDKDQDADTSDSEEGKTMTMSSTAYTAGCEGCSGTTADGTELSGDENVVAVDPDKIPIGSEVHVEGYGDAVAADTGGDINGERIDLHMGDEDEANDWGRQNVKVTVK